ncbi:MAG: DUF3617 domain-containing protein [Methylocella sp.]
MIRKALIFAAPLFAMQAAAFADEVPARKPGLWEIATSQNGSPPDVARLCLDAATESELLGKAKATTAEICSRHEIHRDGDVITDDSVCRPTKSETTSHSVTTLNGDSAYTTVITAHDNPPFMGRADSTTKQDAKWLGPCGADMKPGDLLTHGRKLHITGTP